MKFLARVLPDIYLNNRLLLLLIGCVFLFVLGFPYPIFIGLGKLALLALLVLCLIDLALLYLSKNPISAERLLEEKLSNGDYNTVILKIKGRFAFSPNLKIIDEFPVQLQLRNTEFKLKCKRIFEEEILYKIRPTQRGVYQYGKLRIFTNTKIGLICRRISIDLEKEVKVYPSVIQLKKYSFLAISNRLQEVGVKKVRRIGQSQEFEQIRDYVIGDDFRKINWRATARRQELMVNQNQEEKSQNVYCIIDKGRLMQMPFEGLTLVDYAINSSLVVSGIALGRGDRAGLLTFSNTIGSLIMPKSLSTQMNLISETLFGQKVQNRETDFLSLYKMVKLKLKKRSLLLLYSNFDSLVSLQNQMKYLKAISKNHVLCMVIFDNTEVNKIADKKTGGTKKLYDQTMAEKLQHDKKRIIRELNKNGIYSILTEPQDLTINTINKYIELKARGVL